jgi:hypothetical protein
MCLRAALAVLCAVCGCAPIAALTPPGMTTAVAPGAPAPPVPDPHHLGRVLDPEDSLVVLVVGDNRPGYRTQSQRFGVPQLRAFSFGHPGSWLPAIGGIPLALVQTILPTLDGPQDLLAGFVTRRPNGGGEAQVRAAMTRQLPAELTLNTGDLVFDGRRARLWRDFERKFGTPDGSPEALRARTLYLAAPGNHERLDTPEGRANWSAVMGVPPREDRFWFAIDAGDDLARFIFLDSNVLANVNGVYPEETAETLSREQLAWLDRILETRARFRFVVLHHPLVMVGRHGSDWAPEAAARRRDAVLEICARHGVTAVFAGHEHLYARVYAGPANGDTVSAGKGFWLVTTGGGGGPLHRVEPETRVREMARALPAGLRFAAGSDRVEIAYHFLRLVLPAETDRAPYLDVFAVDQRGRESFIERLSLAPPR